MTPERAKVEQELKDQGDGLTLIKLDRLLLLLIEEAHIISETTTGEDDLMLKGEMRGYRKIVRSITKKP